MAPTLEAGKTALLVLRRWLFRSPTPMLNIIVDISSGPLAMRDRLRSRLKSGRSLAEAIKHAGHGPWLSSDAGQGHNGGVQPLRHPFGRGQYADVRARHPDHGGIAGPTAHTQSRRGLARRGGGLARQGESHGRNVQNHPAL